jgi:hypothetical protein
MSSAVTTLRSSLFTEVLSHIRLLTIDKKSVLEYFSSPYRIALIAIFTALLIPHVFVVVRDINFIMAYEVDPGSMIQALMSLYQNNYNMNEAYHSRYYGWTYFALNYLLLMPVYAVHALNIIKDDYIFFVAIRFVFFLIGLFAVLAYFEVAKRILKNALLAFIAALLFLAFPGVFRYFYFIHPESTGLLFLFLGGLCLLRFVDSRADDYRWYTLGLISLVLSALSKQVFFITALPVLFLFYYSYCYYHNLSIWKFAFSRQFVNTLLFTAALSILLFFIINPFAFIELKTFITNQRVLFSTQTGGVLSREEALRRWIGTIRGIPVIYISILSAPVTLLAAAILTRKHRLGSVFFIVSLVGAILYLILISGSARYLIQIGYFAPIYPFFILTLLIIPAYIVRTWNISLLKFAAVVSLIYFLFYALVTDFTASISTGYARLMYKDTLVYKVYSYVGENIPDGAKIAHDHFVSLPSEQNLNGCHYWIHGCGTDYILEEFEPDYVIFSETWKFNGVTLPETRLLKKYVRQHDFILVDTITHEDDPQVSVWKRPDQ